MKNFIFLLLVCTGFISYSQPISGVWRGKIVAGKGLSASSCKMELKLVKNGDSLLGTAYYFLNSSNFIRYSVKGYFDAVQNAVHWQDQQVLDINPDGKGGIGQFKEAMISYADFNCPGNNIAMLDGTSQIGLSGPQFTLHFDKVAKTFFPDEWDNVIAGYFTGMADPDIIDSVYAIAQPYKAPPVIAKNNRKKEPANTVSDVAVNDGNPAPPVPINTKAGSEVPGETVAKTEPVKPQPVAEKPVDTKPAETIAKAKTDSVATVAKQELPKPVPVPAKPVTDEKTVAKQPVIETPKEAAKDTAPVLASNTKTEIPKAVMPAAKTPEKAADEKAIVKETPKEDKKDAPLIVASSVKPDVPAAVKKDTLKPVVTVAEKSAPKKDSALVAKTETVKPPVVYKPVITVPEKKPESKPPVTNTVAKQTPAVQKPLVQQPVASGAVAVNNPPKPAPAKQPEAAVVAVKKPEIPKPVIIEKTDTVAERLFVTRKKINQGEIPVAGDSIELNFYDNAEVDGDSISLFLNGKLLFNHVLLSTVAHKFKIATADLPNGSELTMVAENLGTIPPNTALMLAFVEGQRYSARIESTEKTSGVIKLVRRK